MARKPISQHEARALKHRVRELEKLLDLQRNAWVREWPDGVHIESVEVSELVYGKLHVARKLGHAVVVTQINRNQLEFYALPLSAKAGA